MLAMGPLLQKKNNPYLLQLHNMQYEYGTDY